MRNPGIGRWKCLHHAPFRHLDRRLGTRRHDGHRGEQIGTARYDRRRIPAARIDIPDADTWRALAARRSRECGRQIDAATGCDTFGHAVDSSAMVTLPGCVP